MIRKTRLTQLALALTAVAALGVTPLVTADDAAKDKQEAKQKAGEKCQSCSEAKTCKTCALAKPQAAADGDGQATAEVGSAAPGFTLTDSNGNEHSLADFQGKYVVLEWINHQCPFVKKHYGAQNMQALQQKHTDDGGVWLTICSSAPGKQGHMSPSQWNEAIETHGMNSTAVLLDEDGTVGKLYDAKVTPHMYVIAPDGTLIYNGAIDSISSANPDDIDKATSYVEEALAAHKAGNDVPNPQTKPYGCSVKY